ncbi:tape measure protein [Pseudoxanthomonas indica]|uniref:Tape measure domain-containing protein n=1 Tax=Pseudoxanthomonas indica TaxID=428993 RepID=A0A1T5K0R8_9GAMM|nr:tape measure protein [Pseudoxanthomonas indica]GGD45695.1 hypothetical protein GCM10007235_17040 [Pseudoxanthomonas indica]SKC57088.1 tape measure domain-containing protein [Pseudoxanthomonas indica]
MSTNGSANLRVRVSADLADIKQGLALLRGEFAKVKKDAAQAAPNDNRWATGLRNIRNQLAGVVSAYAALRGVRVYSELADQAANLAARLKLATRNQEEFEGAYRGTFDIAQRTAAEWDSVVGLYSRLSQSTTLGQREILGLTETISQAFQVSGAGPQDTANGIRQLTQAIAGGTLRAEEFNSIIETSPRIVQALADHFGIAFGKVRSLVNDGKVSTQDLINALDRAGDSIADEFGKLPLTVSRAIQQVRNALIGLVGGTDEATGASKGLAKAISDLATTLQSPGVREGFSAFVQGVSNAISVLLRLGSTAASVSKFVGEEFAARFGGPALEDTIRIEERLQRLRKTMDVVRKANSDTAWNLVRKGDSLLSASELTPGDLFSKRETVLRRLQGEIDKENAKLRTGASLRGRSVAAEEATAQATEKTTAAVAAGGAKVKQIAESNALLQDELRRSLAEVERLYAEHQIGIEEYFRRRKGVQEQAIDAQIQQTRNELAVATDLGSRRNLEEQIIVLQRDRAEAGETAAREQAEAEKDLARHVESVRSRLAALNGDAAEARRKQLEDEFRDQKALLLANGNTEAVAEIDLYINTEVAKAQLEQFREEASKILGNLQGGESSISSQMEAGALGMGEGERRLLDLRKQSLGQLRSLRDAVTDFYAKTKDPSVLAFLTQLDGNIADVGSSMQNFRQDIEDIGSSAFVSAIDDLIEGTKSFKDAFQDMVRSFAAGVAKMIAQELALRAIRSALSAFGSGAGGGGASVPAAHRGGIVGALQMARHNINPLVFGQAPHYHGGGVAGLTGLANDEVAAVLRRGETVRTEQQEAALSARLDSAQGGRPGLVTTPIVAIGESAIADAMSSAAGTNVILTVVKENWEGLSRGAQ